MGLVFFMCRRRKQVENRAPNTEPDWQVEEPKGKSNKEDNVIVPFERVSDDHTNMTDEEVKIS